MAKNCLLFPEHCSFMNEKHRVVAVLHPKPAKNCPIPIILDESAAHIIKSPITKNAHEITIAIFLPQLSAMKGITKKPMSDPK